MIYKWRNRSYPVTAQVAGEVLSTIEQEEGALTPKSIVERSREKSAALHNCFEWNNKKAAEGFRVQQARELIRHLIVVTEQEERETRAFINYQGDNEEGERESVFVNIYSALNDEEQRGYILRTALREAEAFRRKYENLSELAGVIREISAVIDGELVTA